MDTPKIVPPLKEIGPNSIEHGIDNTVVIDFVNYLAISGNGTIKTLTYKQMFEAMRFVIMCYQNMFGRWRLIHYTPHDRIAVLVKLSKH